ncbi:GFA family protein [Streptomyces anulatus]
MNATPATDAQGAETAGERTGGCLCGRIRFTTRGPAVFPHTCACRHCQKLGGAPVMWWVGFETVTWTGEGAEPTWYETFEGEAKRGFCPTCGSRLAAIDSDIPEIGINVTALDDTSGEDLVPIHASFHETPCTGCPRWHRQSPTRPVDLRPPAHPSLVVPADIPAALAGRPGRALDFGGHPRGSSIATLDVPYCPIMSL